MHTLDAPDSSEWESGVRDSLQWDNAIGEQYTGNPYVRFDAGTEVERPPPTLLGWGLCMGM